MKKMFNHLETCLIVMALLIVASGTQANELSPKKTLLAMLEAAENGDWETYVDEFYGEQHKFRSSQDRDSLVARFEKKWGKKVLLGLREAAQADPVLSADGKKAFFQLKKGKFVLYKDDSGKWMFHL